MMPKRWFGVITLFPDMLKALTEEGVVARACQQGILQVEAFNPREWALDRHRTVDDRPYGGGPGMLMKPEPLAAAIRAAQAAAPVPATVIYLAPHGERLAQPQLCEWAASDAPQAFILIAGRYEGIDERIVDMFVDAVFSVGDYVLSGGELPAMTIIDGIARLVPGVLGDQDSAAQDSFMPGQPLDCPHYTRPAEFEGRQVPSVLLSGHAAQIKAWREEQSLARIRAKRPDLLKMGEESKGDEHNHQ